jgi:hypothetical protein
MAGDQKDDERRVEVASDRLFRTLDELFENDIRRLPSLAQQRNQWSQPIVPIDKQWAPTIAETIGCAPSIDGNRLAPHHPHSYLTLGMTDSTGTATQPMAPGNSPGK